MIIKKPFKNADIPQEYYVQLSKIPHFVRELHEMYIFHNNTLVIDHPFRILISLNNEILVNVYDSGIIIIHDYSIIQISKSGNLTITI
jgi:hypothetical protein